MKARVIIAWSGLLLLGAMACEQPISPSLLCQAGATYPNPLPEQRAANLVVEGFEWTEGPIWVASLGALLFSDIHTSDSDHPTGPDAVIHRVTPPNTLDVFIQHAGSNGLALANDGRILAASHDIQSLSLFDPATGAREVLDLTYQGKHFNSPNDLVVRSDGTVYFTDPDYQIGTRSSETGVRGVYSVRPDGRVSLIDATFNEPNGIALSPDERTLYVGSDAPEIIAYTVARDGSVNARRTFAAPGPSDGLTTDCAGNLYVTSKTVQVYDPSGTKLGDITAGEDATNVAFGGSEQKTLYIAAGSGVYTIELRVPGRSY